MTHPQTKAPSFDADDTAARKAFSSQQPTTDAQLLSRIGLFSVEPNTLANNTQVPVPANGS